MPRVMMEVDVPLVPLRRGEAAAWGRAAGVCAAVFSNVIRGKRYATPRMARRIAEVAPSVIGREVDPSIFVNPKWGKRKPRIVPPVMGNSVEGLI